MTARAENMEDIDITVVVTCYNEEAFITDTLDSLIGALEETDRSYEIIVVDDVSKDNSVQRVRDYIQAHPGRSIHLKVNTVNRGLANNYVEAAFLGKGKYYRLCCGDNPEPREVLVNAFKHIGAADIIIPYQLQDAVVGKQESRKLISKVFTFLVNFISGYHLKYYNGLAVHLRYNVMRWHPSSYGFGFQADILTRLLDEGASYLQIPSSGIDRKGSGSTALTMRNFLSVAHTLLELLIRRIRRELYGRTMPRPREIILAAELLLILAGVGSSMMAAQWMS
jgi:glycosyltransferase involved in cell wall biosynthesis